MVDHFVYQMYAYDQSEAKFLDTWEESTNKLWGDTQPHFKNQYAKEQHKLEREQAHKNYESSAVFREAPRSHTIKTLHRGANATTAENSFAASMEYAAELEEKANTQAECIIELKASGDGQTILTEATDFVASAVTTGGSNKDLKELWLMVKQLKYYITPQSATLADLPTKNNSGCNDRGGKNTDKKKSRPVLHMCAHYKREVYHTEGN